MGTILHSWVATIKLLPPSAIFSASLRRALFFFLLFHCHSPCGTSLININQLYLKWAACPLHIVTPCYTIDSGRCNPPRWGESLSTSETLPCQVNQLSIQFIGYLLSLFFGLSISVFMEGQWASRLRAEGSQGSGEFCIFAMADVALSQTLKVFAMAFGHFAETIWDNCKLEIAWNWVLENCRHLFCPEFKVIFSPHLEASWNGGSPKSSSICRWIFHETFQRAWGSLIYRGNPHGCGAVPN